MHLCPSRLTARRAIVRIGQAYKARAPSVDGLLTPRQACPRDGPSGATCVQRLDGSRDSAIHTMYRISLRSSSMREPRYPLPGVISFLLLWPRQIGRRRSTAVRLSVHVFLGVNPRHVPAPRPARPEGRELFGAGGTEEVALTGSVSLLVHRSCFQKATTMILPQVHLRKPCYDFSFL
jgi:hypothetical protein